MLRAQSQYAAHDEFVCPTDVNNQRSCAAYSTNSSSTQGSVFKGKKESLSDNPFDCPSVLHFVCLLNPFLKKPVEQKRYLWKRTIQKVSRFPILPPLIAEPVSLHHCDDSPQLRPLTPIFTSETMPQPVCVQMSRVVLVSRTVSQTSNLEFWLGVLLVVFACEMDLIYYHILNAVDVELYGL
ncbi:hypothetical protein EVAR_97174_1 [Eumeta japonica]|uniref:Uncharacterized protein n=1 Tax=Eumeta variegata TaxID=151549 RepID=A0A4C1XTA2_EUMVA|nr:hypothetical protein EVAR_97174_1 [Eumeta japonica]